MALFSVPQGDGKDPKPTEPKAARKQRHASDEQGRNSRSWETSTKVLLATAIALSAVLCWVYFGPKSNPAGIKLYPAEGKIVYADGSAAVELAGGSVSFESKDGRYSARGAIHGDASFKVATLEQGDGAPAGEYRVLIRPPAPEKFGAATRRLIDPRFTKFTTSGLTATIQSGKNEIRLQVERPFANSSGKR